LAPFFGFPLEALVRNDIEQFSNVSAQKIFRKSVKDRSKSPKKAALNILRSPVAAGDAAPYIKLY
jgi:hypothetical protein